MTLAEIISGLSTTDDELEIHARAPWSAESEAFVDDNARDGFELVCGVREAKGSVRLYVADPLPVQVARVLALAARLKGERELAAVAARSFSYREQVVGYFLTDVPDREGQYPYMPYRSQGHLAMVEELCAGGSPTCTVRGRIHFRVVRLADRRAVEIADVEHV